MGLPSRRRIKKELNRRLLYYPLLRMLLFKVWFRVAFMCAVTTAFLLGLYLPKIWRTSPDGFDPIIKVSALDLTQNWSLKRSARQAEQEKDVPRAYLSWQGAVAQNPADENAVRGFLNNFLKVKAPDQRQTMTAIQQSLWLLRLTKTNMTDVDLCARVYEQFRLHDIMLYVLTPIEKKLSGNAEIAYTKALFHFGRVNEFAERLPKLESKDPELDLYRLAYIAGWSMNADSIDARAALERAMEQNETKALATRLAMAAAQQRRDVGTYEKCLRSLETLNENRVADYTVYWKLLAAAGRDKEARREAESFTTSPASALEVLRLAEVYFQLGLIEQSREVLKRFAPEFGHSPEVWSSYTSVLEDLKDWTEMRAAALRMRDQPNYRDTLGGYAHFVEGRAELGEGRTPTAEVAFRKASDATYDIPALGYVTARELLKLNYPQYARPILSQVESEMKDRGDYWETVFHTAFALRDGELLLKAAEANYHAKPRDVVAANRFAAALLINRTRPDEAVKVTLEILNNHPGSSTAVINHALALLLVRRDSEAKAELDRVNVASLPPIEAAAYYQALFEWQMNQQLLDDAKRIVDRLNIHSFFPAQKQWFDEQMKKLSPAVTAAL